MEVLKSRPELTSLIKSVCTDASIKNYQIQEVRTNQKGEGYLGEIFMVTIHDCDSEKLHEMVIKAAFKDEKVRGLFPIRLSFQNEIYFYKEVKPAMEKFEREKGVKSVSLVPNCLKVSLTDSEEILVLEDLKALKFETFDKKLMLSDDHVKLIFQTYGRFHGFSFALKDQKPDEFAKLASGCYNVWGEFARNELFGKHLVDIANLVQKLLLPGEDNEIIEKFQKYADTKITDIFTDLTYQEVEHCAILHGDCWSNNMLFKYEASNSTKPTDIRLIDFQLIKVGSPVCDLSYFLYSGSSKGVFDNLNKYLRIYYDSFSNYVRELGSDPEKVFPFEVLKEHWKKFARFGMIMSLTILKMKLTHKEDIIDFTDDFELEDVHDLIAQQKFDEEDYNKRVRGLLWHLAEVDAL